MTSHAIVLIVDVAIRRRRAPNSIHFYKTVRRRIKFVHQQVV